MAGTGETLSTKAGIPTQIIYNGCIAITFFLITFKRAWRRSKILNSHPPLAYISRVFLIFILLTILFAADINTLYIYLLPIVLLEHAAKFLKPYSPQ